MNLILLGLFALFALVMVLAIVRCRFQREECHNADDPKPPGAEEKAPKEKAVKEKPAPVAEAPSVDASEGEIPELEIIAKIQAGLTRDQAIEVITNQRAHDKALAAQG